MPSAISLPHFSQVVLHCHFIYIAVSDLQNYIFLKSKFDHMVNCEDGPPTPGIVGLKSVDTSSSKTVALMHVHIKTLVSLLHYWSHLLSLLCKILYLYWILKYCQSQRFCSSSFIVSLFIFFLGVITYTTNSTYKYSSESKISIVKFNSTFSFLLLPDLQAASKTGTNHSSLEYFFSF